MASHSSKGFSLIELMIALAIIAIVAAVALPAYREHMWRARIPEATSTLSSLAMRLEQHYQDHRRYGDKDTCAVPMPSHLHFTFKCEASNGGQSFMLTANGTNNDGMSGFIFTLDQNGNARTTGLPEGWGSTPVDCWISKRGARC